MVELKKALESLKKLHFGLFFFLLEVDKDAFFKEVVEFILALFPESDHIRIEQNAIDELENKGQIL